MGKLAVVVAVLVLLPALAAEEEKPKPVEVINFPATQNVGGNVSVDGAVDVNNFPAVQTVAGSVEVTNFPPPAAPARFQFVGFPAAQYTGGEGIYGFTKACQLEFPGSRMCQLREAVETTVVPLISSGAGWIDPGIPNPNDQNCSGWAQDHGTGTRSGAVWSWEGQISSSRCFTAQSVACCALVAD